jgi:hypothetical protein
VLRLAAGHVGLAELELDLLGVGGGGATPFLEQAGARRDARHALVRRVGARERDGLLGTLEAREQLPCPDLVAQLGGELLDGAGGSGDDDGIVLDVELRRQLDGEANGAGVDDELGDGGLRGDGGTRLLRAGRAGFTGAAGC